MERNKGIAVSSRAGRDTGAVGEPGAGIAVATNMLLV